MGKSAVVLATLCAAATVMTPLQASASSARVVASPATADPDYATTLTLSGSGFQSIKNGHGGIYVLFGWVSDPGGGSWKPSRGGSTGSSYRYVQDSETKSNNGFQRFVAFPGSDTAGSSNGGVIDASGSWRAQLNVPGASFRTMDREGKVVDVNCRTVQCGVITVGAHGVVNANNETFTPITFAAPAGRQGAARTNAAPPRAVPPAQPSTQAKPSAAKKTTKPKAKPKPVKVALTNSSLKPGDKTTASGSGFAPNERITVTAHSQPRELAPITADRSGTFKTELTVPADLEPGAHRIVFHGNKSQRETTVNLTVDAPAPAPALTPQAAPQEPQTDWSWLWWTGGAIVVIGAAAGAVWRIRSRKAQA